MALTRTESEREARDNRVVLLLSVVNFVGAVAIEARRNEATGREQERAAAAEDEEAAAATRDCWASPRMTQSRREKGPGEVGRERKKDSQRAFVGEVQLGSLMVGTVFLSSAFHF